MVGALGLLCELRSAPRERWYLLLVAFAALLAHQPRALGDPGLQLSFAAVLGLLIVTPPLAAWARGWMPGRLADLTAMAAAASLATAPVLAWNFGRLSLAGLALNVVAVPLAAPIVVLALAGLAAGALVPAAGVALAWVAGLGAGALLLAARAAAAIPGAAVDLPSGAALGARWRRRWRWRCWDAGWPPAGAGASGPARCGPPRRSACRWPWPAGRWGGRRRRRPGPPTRR